MSDNANLPDMMLHDRLRRLDKEIMVKSAART
jgi:hypothetical protein